MFLDACRFCGHGNPPESKFCNACGGALHLVPCPRCGAVNDVTAAVCYQCHDHLPGRRTGALVPAEPDAEVSKPMLRQHFRVMVGAAVLAAISVLGYYSYRQHSLADMPHPPAASNEASGPGGSAGAGVIRQEVVTKDTVSAKANDSAGSANAATAPPVTPVAGPTRAVANRPRAGREPLESREANVVATPSARATAINADRARERGLSRPEACTEAVAALGLCTLKPVQKKEPETTATIGAAIARSQTAEADKAGGPEPRHQEACTESVAALGLCTPTPTPRRK